jgi:hypothetical protein
LAHPPALVHFADGEPFAYLQKILNGHSIEKLQITHIAQLIGTEISTTEEANKQTNKQTNQQTNQQTNDKLKKTVGKTTSTLTVSKTVRKTVSKTVSKTGSKTGSKTPAGRKEMHAMLCPMRVGCSGVLQTHTHHVSVL